MQNFISKNSIVLTETGTSTCGLANNDVQPWNYSKLPRIFGKDTWTAKVKTPDELEKILKELPKHPNQLRFVEVVMGKYDYPEMLKNIVAALEKMRQQAYKKKTRG